MKRCALKLCMIPLTLLLATAPAALAAEHQERVSRTFSARSGATVDLENLVGAVTIEGGGGEVAIEAVVTARADSDAEARKLASMVKVDFAQDGGDVEVVARFPVDRYDTYHYPGSSGSKGWMGGGNTNTRTRYGGKRVTVTSRASQKAATVWVDFRLTLPSGVGADVENAAGAITATGVDGPLDLETGSGEVTVRDGRGELSIDTGSGDVELADHEGEIEIDTGSGGVRVLRTRGNLAVDTGSGDVEVEGADGREIDVDTGSGDIRLVDVRGQLTLDTGSGSIEGRELVATGDLEADTGSGGISLSGDLSDVGAFSLDTGSGGVELVSTSFPPMDLDISTGSGGIDVDLPGLEVIEKDRNTLRARYQGGGAELSIDTGSGGVTVRQE